MVRERGLASVAELPNEKLSASTHVLGAFRDECPRDIQTP